MRALLRFIVQGLVGLALLIATGLLYWAQSGQTL
jgi:hypothetical protein